MYITLKKEASCDINNCHIGEGIYQSYFGGITLLQFIKARVCIAHRITMVVLNANR
jgi:hypothetical protein